MRRMGLAETHPRGSRWLRRGSILLAGIVLGLLQFLSVIGLWSWFPQGWRPFWLSAAAFSLLISLLIPALAGFQSSRRGGHVQKSLYVRPTVPDRKGTRARKSGQKWTWLPGEGVGASGADSGCLVGGIGFLVVAISSCVFLPALSPPSPSCSPRCGPGLGAAGMYALAGFFVWVEIAVFILAQGAIAVAGFRLGSWADEAVGRRRATGSRRGSGTVADKPPLE
jgi:hypothetical protein